MTLYFNTFETAILFTTILVVNVCPRMLLTIVVFDSRWSEQLLGRDTPDVGVCVD
jgi:hypothetical protein